METPAYDFWLLDLDGTLVDVEPSYVRETFDRIGDRLGCRFTDREADRIWHGYGGLRDATIRGCGVEPAAFWSALREVEDPEARVESTYLHDDAAVVGDIDAPVGLVTHCQPYLAEPVLGHLGVRDWFDAVVCCSDRIGWKPDPAPVYRAMADIGANDGDRGVLVGDGPHDVGAAWNAGLDAAHVERHGTRRRGGCVLGDHRVDRLTDLVSPGASAPGP